MPTSLNLTASVTQSLCDSLSDQVQVALAQCDSLRHKIQLPAVSMTMPLLSSDRGTTCPAINRADPCIPFSTALLPGDIVAECNIVTSHAYQQSPHTCRYTCAVNNNLSAIQRRIGACSWRSLPSINVYDRPVWHVQVALVGAPNVGKSSLVNVLSSGVPEVCDYPFTTRSIKMGHFYVNGQRHQVHDLRRVGYCMEQRVCMSVSDKVIFLGHLWLSGLSLLFGSSPLCICVI